MFVFKGLVYRKTLLGLSVALLLGSGITSTQAGFEWIPQQTSPEPISEMPNIVPPPVVADTVVIPMPSDANAPIAIVPQSPAVVQNVPPPAPAPAMEYRSMQPVPNPVPMPEALTQPIPTQPLAPLPHHHAEVVVSPAPPIDAPVIHPQGGIHVPPPPEQRLSVIPNEAPNSGVIMQAPPPQDVAPHYQPPPRHSSPHMFNDLASAPPPPGPGLVVPDNLPPAIPPVIMPSDAPPVATQNMDTLPVMPPAPAPAYGTVPSSPRVVIADDAPLSARESLAISAAPSTDELMQTMNTPMPTIDGYVAPAPVVQTSVDPAGFANAVGFANDVPLALALRQVVPASYAFSFDRGVNPGALVSWNGGKPWNEVLSEMVLPVGYGIRIMQKRVLIVNKQQLNFDSQMPGTSNSGFNPVPAPVPVPMQPSMTIPLLEPAAGEEEDVLPSLDSHVEAGLRVVESPDVQVGDDLVISSADAPLPQAVVTRPRHVKRINITDPGAEEVQANDNPFPLIQDSQNLSVAEDTIAARNNEVAPAAGTNSFFNTAESVTSWTASKGSSLKDTVMSWSQAANTEIVWDAAQDYTVGANFEINGSFEKAVDLLLKRGVASGNKLTHSYVAQSADEDVKLVIADQVKG